MNLLNVKNFADLKRIVKILGPQTTKALIPVLVPMIMSRIPADIKFTDAKAAESTITGILMLVVDLVLNVE